MAAAASPTQGQRGVDISTVPTPQLSNVKNQLQQDVQHLTSSFTQLRTAQSKFRDCVKSVGEGLEGKDGGTPLLVPLTSSLYVPGKLCTPHTVLVDVGTGFYVEKSPTDAKQFYNAKIEELGKNLGELEGIVKQKDESLRVVEEGLLIFLLFFLPVTLSSLLQPAVAGSIQRNGKFWRESCDWSLASGFTPVLVA